MIILINSWLLYDKTKSTYCFISKERSDEGVNGDGISEEEERRSKFQTEVCFANLFSLVCRL